MELDAKSAVFAFTTVVSFVANPILPTRPQWSGIDRETQRYYLTVTASNIPDKEQMKTVIVGIPLVATAGNNL